MTQFFIILLGAALLIAGHRFFWLFVGAIGFIAGMEYLAPLFMEAGGVGSENTLAVLLGGFGGGILGALLAFFAQGFSILVSGFIAGGQILSFLLHLFFPLSSQADLFFSIMGGVMGAGFFILYFDFAIIVLTTLWGGSIIISQFSLTQPMAIILYAVLLVFGITVQFALARNQAIEGSV